MISTVKSRWSFIAGALTFLQEAIVLIGWHTQSPALVKIYPAFNVMIRYNAALCLFLLGLGLAAANVSYKGLSKTAGALVGLLGFLTFSEDMFAVDLGIDELLMSDYLRSNPVHPGHMSPIASISLVMMGVALFIANLESAPKQLFAIAGILSAIGTGLGFAAVLGYVTGLETAYRWGRDAPIALHAAVGIIALGAGLVLLTWNKERSPRLPRWFPAGTVAFFSVIALSLRQALNAVEPRTILPEIVLALVIVMGLFIALGIRFAQRESLYREIERHVAEIDAINQELESFSYSVSHDLRTPLRAIDGFSHILLDEYQEKLDDEGRRLLNVVRDNTKKMGQLIDDILAFSRVGRQEIAMSAVDMEKLARDVFDELRSLEAGRDLKLDVKPLSPAYADRATMCMVLVNLLSNAIKFTRPKGTAIVEVGGWTEGAENVYYVNDNGVGFDMRYVGKLFGVFQRLHATEEFEGTGIGLAIVKRIVTRHGGRVWAESKVNGGATFFFTLPKKEIGHE